MRKMEGRTSGFITETTVKTRAECVCTGSINCVVGLGVQCMRAGAEAATVAGSDRVERQVWRVITTLDFIANKKITLDHANQRD